MVHLWISVEARGGLEWERWRGHVDALRDGRWGSPLEEFRGGGG